MTPIQSKFVALEKKKNEYKLFFQELKEVTEQLAKEIGIGGMFQDLEGTVYKVVEPEGKFVHFEKISYVRTKRPDEKRGDLSVKEAQEAGFSIPK